MARSARGRQPLEDALAVAGQAWQRAMDAGQRKTRMVDVRRLPALRGVTGLAVGNDADRVVRRNLVASLT